MLRSLFHSFQQLAFAMNPPSRGYCHHCERTTDWTHQQFYFRCRHCGQDPHTSAH